MFEQELLSDEFRAILDCKQLSTQRLEELLQRLPEPSLRKSISQLQISLLRHVQLSQRLVEIVS
jgi:hypothetical protein